MDVDPPLETPAHKLLLLLADFSKNTKATLSHATRAQPNLTALHCKNILQSFAKLNPALRGILVDSTVFSKLDIDALDALYNELCAVFSTYYAVLCIPAPIDYPRVGKLKYTHLLMLLVALCDHTRTVHADKAHKSRLEKCCAGDFPFVRSKALAYNEHVPIATYSLSTIMNALYAVYSEIPHLQYNRELESYTHMLMWRARQFLVIAHPQELNDVSQLRTKEAENSYSWSAQLLYDLTILEKYLLGWFDPAGLVDRVDKPSLAHIPTPMALSFRNFVRNTASTYSDSELKVDFVACNLRPGELEFYENAVLGEDPNVYSAIQTFRPATYTAIMEKAQLPLQKLLLDVMRTDPDKDDEGFFARQTQSFQFSLTVLYVFIKQLTKHVSSFNTDSAIIKPGMFSSKSVHMLHAARAKKQPVIVWCCNALQLWHNNKLYMYNDPIATCITWMLIINSELDNKFNSVSINPLIEAAFYSFETPDERAKRKTQDAKQRSARKILQ